MKLPQSFEKLLLDQLGIQIDAFTWQRYRLIQRFVAAGPIRTLNIGTGGGFETLAMLRKGNHVTTIELGQEASARTHARAIRNGYGEMHRPLVGHVLEIDLSEKFDQIVMCEVLEHIVDDYSALGRLADWLKPGGRLVMSTPTASFGQLPGDQLSPREDGGHVRVGYDGPELDRMLISVGLIPVNRVLNGYFLTVLQHVLERRLKAIRVKEIGLAFAVVCRPLIPLFEQVRVDASDQITLAIRKDDRVPELGHGRPRQS
jgi:SAM-dependent methyltransferase